MTEVFRSLRWDWLWSKARFDTLLALLLVSVREVSVREVSGVVSGLVKELPVRVLSRELPVALMLSEPVRVSCSTLAGAV